MKSFLGCDGSVGMVQDYLERINFWDYSKKILTTANLVGRMASFGKPFQQKWHDSTYRGRSRRIEDEFLLNIDVRVKRLQAKANVSIRLLMKKKLTIMKVKFASFTHRDRRRAFSRGRGLRWCQMMNFKMTLTAPPWHFSAPVVRATLIAAAWKNLWTVVGDS